LQVLEFASKTVNMLYNTCCGRRSTGTPTVYSSSEPIPFYIMCSW